MAIVRVRQHVNPLSQKYQSVVTPPDWSEIYGDPQRSLHIDIGCGKGQFLLQMAQLVPDWNFLGLEIREPVVDMAQQYRDQAELTNLHFLFCNANTSLQSLMASWPVNPLRRVTIQFPDPWFKKRHQKRRVVQPELVSQLAHYLPSGGEVILQSDVEEVALEMSDRFSENPSFQRQSSGWLPQSPFPAQTERERLTLEKGLPVYRVAFKKR